jgi:putative proteasome-type protease
MLVYEDGSLAVTRFVTIDEKNQYFQMLRNSWGRQLKAVFENIDAPLWDAAPGATENVLSSTNMHSKPVRVALPAALGPVTPAAPLQSVAEHPPATSQH